MATRNKILSNIVILQPTQPLGRDGDLGRSVQQPAGPGPKSGLGHAVVISVPGVQRRSKTVYQLSVQVSQVSIIPLHGRRHFTFLNLNP